MTITFDGPNRRIILGAGTAVDAREIWSRWVDWSLTGDNAKYLPAFRQLGGDTIDPSSGTTVPIYLFLLNNWRVRPQEANHTLAVTGAIILVDGGGDPFANTLGTFNVRINYQQPVQAITVSTGGSGGGLSAGDAEKLDDLHKIHGLDPAAPLVVSDSARSAGGVEQTITGTTAKTVSRQ